MKRIGMMVMALSMMMSAEACIGKKQVSVGDVTIIVTDTTQALLDGATAKVGKEVVVSSYDGRIVLKEEQIDGLHAIRIGKEGYEGQKIHIAGEKTMIVRLVPRKQKKQEKEDATIRVRGTKIAAKGEARYYTMHATAEMLTEDAAVGMAMPMAIAETEDMAMANNVSAGRLTAGEVNDFAKWQLWPGEKYERYTVQVVNKSGFGIANYPVNLTDTKGNTIYQAVTDNTGKAELWNGMMGQRAEVAQEPWQTIVVDEGCEASEGVDVVFVFDATGSMGDELQYLQAEMKDVIARATAATGGLAIRTGAVVYRDHGDEYITRLSRLTDQLGETQAFIDKQYANGGGDYPEAIPEALMAAINSAGWDNDARTRIAFLILDAPCHEDSVTKKMLQEQVLNAAAQGVRIVPIVCSGLDKRGEMMMRSMALATNGTSFFLTDDSGIGNPHLKPTTDSIKVEHLNDMMVRTIVAFSSMPDCTDPEDVQEIEETFLPNPFQAEDLANDPSIPHGEGVHYLIDVSGKLITVFEGTIYDYQQAVMKLHLPIGLYFVKTYFDGQWHTQKVLVR